jgi:hypothetical protein
VVGKRVTHHIAFLLVIAALGAVIVGPLNDAAVASDPTTQDTAGAPHPRLGPFGLETVTTPAPKGFSDDAAQVSFDPPVGWVREPPQALNPESDPPDPAQELVRFQLRSGDASLYAQPIPITSALIRDAGAIISIGVARSGGELLDLDVDPRAERADANPVAGFFQLEEERTYEGLHVLTRYFVSRATDRRLVARAVTAEEDWFALGPIVRASIDSLRADPNGSNAPAAPPPSLARIQLSSVVRPGPAMPAPAEPQSEDASLGIRRSILDRASAMLSTPYVWGSNSANRAMDCSAYVSAAWGVARYTTESIGWVSAPISKQDLRSGDAMNLTMGRDPEGYGHIRLFEAWANDAHTLVWVFEETPPRAVHRVVVYDDRYQPIRLTGLSNAGVAPLVPAPAPTPEERFAAGAPQNNANGGSTRSRSTTARPATPRPTTRPTPRPVATRAAMPTPVVPGPVLITPPPSGAVRATTRPTRSPAPTPTAHR